MEMDDLIDELLVVDASTKQSEPGATTAQRERLATIAAGGQAR